MIQKKSYYSTACYYFLACILVHGLVLVNDGVFWDGTLLVGFYQDNNLEQLHLLFFSMGIPTYYYVTKLLWLTNFEKIPNYIGPISIYIAAFFSYLSARLFKQVSHTTAFLIGLFIIFFPGSMITYFHAIVNYYIDYAGFFIAFYAGLRAEIIESKSAHVFLRLLSLVLFCFSFSMKSLLVYYFLFIVCLYYLKGERLTKFVRTRIDYWILPIVFWVACKFYFKPSLAYADYNSIHVSVLYFIRDFIRSVNFTVLRVITVPSVIFVLFYVFKKNKVTYRKEYRYLMFLGFLALLLALTPYVLVGKPPIHHYLPDSRYAMLVPSAMALILAAFMSMFFLQNNNKLNSLGKLFIVVFLGYFGWYWFDNYLCLELDTAFKKSFVKKLSEHKSWGNYSTYWIKIKGFRGIQTNCAPYEWAYLFNTVYAGHSRIGYSDESRAPENLKRIQSMMASSYERGRYNVIHLDANGRQAEMTIQPGLASPSVYKLGVTYLVDRFIYPDRLNDFLTHLTDVNLTPWNIPEKD